MGLFCLFAVFFHGELLCGISANDFAAALVSNKLVQMKSHLDIWESQDNPIIVAVHVLFNTQNWHIAQMKNVNVSLLSLTVSQKRCVLFVSL